MFKTTVHASPARLQAAAFQHLLLEAEFTFAFRDGLPPRAKPYAREEVLEAIEAVIPSIEVISPRFKRLSVDHTPQFIADFSGNAATVLGTPCRDWRALDLAAQGAAMIIGGVKRQEGTGAVTLGNPLNVLEWLVAAMATRGQAIAQGRPRHDRHHDRPARARARRNGRGRLRRAGPGRGGVRVAATLANPCTVGWVSAGTTSRLTFER